MASREAMIQRLRDLRGCKFSSAKGVHGLICWYGLYCLDEPAFVLFDGQPDFDIRPMSDAQIAEVLRCGEKFIEKQTYPYVANDLPQVDTRSFAEPEYADGEAF